MRRLLPHLSKKSLLLASQYCQLRQLYYKNVHKESLYERNNYILVLAVTSLSLVYAVTDQRATPPQTLP